MAKLHLLIDLNEVTDAEFRALCDALEGKAGQAGDAARARRCAQPPRRRICARCAAPGNARRTRPRGAAAAGAPGNDRQPEPAIALTGVRARA